MNSLAPDLPSFLSRTPLGLRLGPVEVVVTAVRRTVSVERNDDLLPVIDDIRPQQIARGLNGRGIAAERLAGRSK